jgi:purine-nucleoside phosphorylase
MLIPTPHIEAKSQDEIAKTVIMPGDPLRAKLIAEIYLEHPVQFNSVRGMLGYTGIFKGQRLSVMGSGMGIPSMGIYSYELFALYEVDTIIRVGSCGSYHPEYKVHDVILALDSYSESTYAQVQNATMSNILESSKTLNEKIVTAAQRLNIPLKNSRIHTSEVFYRKDLQAFKTIRDTYGCNVVEMESFALFANAKELGKNAACLLTVSDSLITHEATSWKERQDSFIQMLELSLNAATL